MELLYQGHGLCHGYRWLHFAKDPDAGSGKGIFFFSSMGSSRLWVADVCVWVFLFMTIFSGRWLHICEDAWEVNWIYALIVFWGKQWRNALSMEDLALVSWIMSLLVLIFWLDLFLNIQNTQCHRIYKRPISFMGSWMKLWSFPAVR